MSPGVSVMSPGVSARSPWLLLAIPTRAAQPAALGHTPTAPDESPLAGAYFPPVAINRARRTGPDQSTSKLGI